MLRIANEEAKIHTNGTKVKAAPLDSTKALEGIQIQLLLILDLGTRWG
jgi:hypothetical protein